MDVRRTCISVAKVNSRHQVIEKWTRIGDALSFCVYVRKKEVEKFGGLNTLG